MKAKTLNSNMQKTVKRLSLWALAVAAVLMIPFVTNAPWTGSDYVFAGVVLFGSATMYELITRNITNKNYRIVVGVAAAGFVVFIWGLAVAGP